MRTVPIATVLAVLCSVCLIATQAAPQQPPKEEAKAAPTVAGKWMLTVALARPDSVSTLEIKLDGMKVTGTIAATMSYPISGEYTDGKLAFSMDYQGQATVAFTGALKADGTMEGTMEYGEGPVPWRAERQKD